eukprot:TRINITY_DN3479_c0_g1_i1.p1 TRINITY_DN3479_c0_g1~~TRINITY_DN3479_c0_g1_i1.p1  ORF type:complete len:218 (-),score=36.19 TRINITY_DN3479_c0_g1_i1:283-936(-)
MNVLLAVMRTYVALPPGEGSWKRCSGSAKLAAPGAVQHAGLQRHGHLEVLQWAHANGCPWSEEVCSAAAEGGHLELLQWARANDCPWSKRVCSGAASGGHLELLQWAHANGCPWDQEVCSAAAAGGHLEVLQWARANGCPWSESACYDALGDGHCDVLRWALANGAPHDHGRLCWYAMQECNESNDLGCHDKIVEIQGALTCCTACAIMSAPWRLLP